MDAEPSDGPSRRRRRALSLIAIAAVVVVAASIAYLSPRLTSKTSPGRQSISPGLVTGSRVYIVYDVVTPSLAWALEVSTVTGDNQYRVYRTSDAARHWQLQLEGQSSGAFGTLPSIRFFDRTHGYFTIGFPIELYLTADGGAHWVSVALPDAEADFADFSDSRRGWVLVSKPDSTNHAPHLFATGDAGSTWLRLPDPPPGSFRITFRSKSEGWLWTTGTGPSRLYSSVDAGQSWQSLDMPNTPGQQPDENTIVVAVRLLPGNGVVAYLAVLQGSGFSLPMYEFTSFDLGTSWRYVPLRPNQTDNSESFEDAFHWWAIDGATLSKSSDAGQTWSEVSAYIENGEFWRYDVYLLDSKHAWAQINVGDGTGLVITNDGGFSWTRVNVPRAA